MNAQAFWNVIGNYNRQTWIIQIVLLIVVMSAIMLSYNQKVKWAAKFMLGIANLFIGIVFLRYMEQNLSRNFSLCHYILFVAVYFYTKVGEIKMIY